MNGFARRTGPAIFAALLCALLAEAASATGTVPMAQNAPPAARSLRGPAAAPPAPPAVYGEDRQLPISPPARSAQAPAAPAQPQQPAAAPPKIPTRTEILRFDGWVVTCNEFTEPKTRVCAMLLQILQQNTNQVVFSWTVELDNSKQATTIMQTPTGVAIPPGVELRIGKSPARKVPFASCDNGRCIATMIMDANLLREMAATPTAEAVIQGSQGNTVQFNIQMKGFDKAYAVLSRS
jgi:invasion protein IalB